MLTDIVIKLREHGIQERWSGEQQHDALEYFLFMYNEHKHEHGTYKYLQGDKYIDAMKERLSYCWDKTIKYMVK